MKNLKTIMITAAIIGVINIPLHWNSNKSSKKPEFQQPGTLEAMTPPKSLRMLVDETCGACHSNTHMRPPGEYSLNNGAAARARGVVAGDLDVDPFEMTGGEPRTSLVVRKPLEGSVTPHGGIKIPESHPAMAAIIDWVSRGAPANEMDRPATEISGMGVAAPQYAVGVGADEHAIIFTRRQYQNQGFKTQRNSAQGGNIFRLRFHNDPITGVNTIIGAPENITQLPAEDDAQHPFLSLDASRLAFARRVDNSGRWKIWETNADGSGGLRQITTGNDGHDIDPVYLPYKPDGSPALSGDGGVAFLSDSHGIRDEYNTTVTLSLFVSDENGGNRRQIDFNPSHSLHPWLHSSGMLVFTRWEHNEHQRQNFMSLFHISASDYETAGTNLFGVFGEHDRANGNSMHDPAELLDASYGQTHDLLAGTQISNPGHSNMVGRRSMRDDMGGSIVGPFFPRLQGETNTDPVTNLIVNGDNIEGTTMELEPDDDFNAISSFTYRKPRSLMNGLYVVSVATLTHITHSTNSFTLEVSTVVHYSNWKLYTFRLDGNNKITQFSLLHDEAGFNFEEAIANVQVPIPPKIGKPIDLSMNTGVFTSGDVTIRQQDGQARGFSAGEVPVVRFLRALQKSQGVIDTGRENDQGIATQIIGEAPVHVDGSFAANVPANTPIQFQLVDQNGQVRVSHKPWVQVAPGETMRCVGCHAPHNAVATPQQLIARQGNPSNALDVGTVNQFHFAQDIQPIFDNKCISCHDDALVQGAAGRSRGLSLVGRMTPAGTTESYQALIGEGMMTNAYVRTQNSAASPLIHWLRGKDRQGDDFPDPADAVNHPSMLTAEELELIIRWIDTGINFRVVDNDNVINNLAALDQSTFDNEIWPYLQVNCVTCHSTGGSGEFPMNLDNGQLDPDDQVDPIEVVAARLNYMVPEASEFLRKPLPEAVGGLSHTGGEFFTGLEDPMYLTILQWIQSTNPALSGPIVTDLVSVSNYPNPFKDTTQIVYGLTGAAATKVEIKIYSQSGQVIRELSGPTSSGLTIGWNRVIWNGKDKNGKTVGNDVYFYVIKAEFGDGTKKKFRGKIVKLD